MYIVCILIVCACCMEGITTMSLDISVEMLRLDCTLPGVLLSTCTCTLYVCITRMLQYIMRIACV